ncbi:MAG: mechanosensitive ion channel, partial [Polyangiaceae bacterium]|nr:mechanosensitive ion channel [Polyangiaceae bacterium]
LDRVDAAGGPVWVISRSTLAELPALYDRYGPALLERHVPEWFPSRRFAGVWLWQWLGLLGAAVIAALLSALVTAGLLFVGRRLAARTEADWDDRLVTLMRGPARLFGFVAFGWLLLEAIGLTASARYTVGRVLVTLLIFGIAWLAQRAARLASEVIEDRVVRIAREGAHDPARVRGIHTQVVMIRRLVSMLIAFLAASLMLLQFEVVRTVGMSLLASAGIVGIVVGVAAQSSLATLLAGIQLSITQPIRIGDRVSIENEIGTIEEIGLTYVVVKIWDERRLVVPVARFLNSPFQNWTKASAELIGAVLVHADYALPVPEVRRAFDAFVEAHPQWDRRTKSLVVFEVRERTIELRALVSAKNADDVFALRCDVREWLVAHLRDLDGGRYLPRVRVDDRGAVAEHGA